MKLSSRGGFTLIEIMISVIIIALVVGTALPRLTRSTGSQTRKITRQVVSLNRELRNFARLKQKTYRLVIDFGSEKSGPGLYVESASNMELLGNKDEEESTDSKKGDERKSPFQIDKEVLKKPIELPSGINFESVELEGREGPITSGQAYIHFFPHGLVQRSIINIGDGKSLHWSLVIQPLTGQTLIKTDRVQLKDFE